MEKFEYLTSDLITSFKLEIFLFFPLFPPCPSNLFFPIDYTALWKGMDPGALLADGLFLFADKELIFIHIEWHI